MDKAKSNQYHKISVIIDDDKWLQNGDYEFWCNKTQTISAAVIRKCFEFSVLLTNDIELQNLNSRFRNKDYPTNVLSFPEYSPKEISCGKAKGFIGDIAISYETLTREANNCNIPFIDHFSHLLVHSLLHLLGFDHISSKDAKIMEAYEVSILKKLGIPDPYSHSLQMLHESN